MKKRILYYIWMACAAVLLHSCEDVETHKPYGDDSGHALSLIKFIASSGLMTMRYCIMYAMI